MMVVNADVNDSEMTLTPITGRIHRIDDGADDEVSITGLPGNAALLMLAHMLGNIEADDALLDIRLRVLSPDTIRKIAEAFERIGFRHCH